ncbi:hypothetical protein KVF89_25510 [Nocardioides carbamazepini]|uniref:hypothetical protein n=1 Tax=Nocardioides carbamazepini TaxID=2854259 RepID=UPI00214A4244|nr:hypothetical protein [Nocardioides carbamazepini]MCR1785918.1 hypothetical protein [Nocardioides carbamazepini]
MMAGFWRSVGRLRQRCCHGPGGSTYRISALVHLVRAIAFGIGCVLTVATCIVGVAGWIWATPSWLVESVAGATSVAWASCFFVALGAEPSAVWERRDLKRRRSP